MFSRWAAAMTAKPPGVYCDPSGRWYFKIRTGRDPITGERGDGGDRSSPSDVEACRIGHPATVAVQARLDSRYAGTKTPGAAPT
jgi:hypothetical protein